MHIKRVIVVLAVLAASLGLASWPASAEPTSVAAPPSTEFLYTTKAGGEMYRVFTVGSVEDFFTTDRAIDTQPGGEIRAVKYGNAAPAQWDYYRVIGDTYWILQGVVFLPQPLCAFGHCHQVLANQSTGGNYPGTVDFLAPA
ncbi:hypothetical protein GCM10007304_22410 [Rhodococcoides trifolii]|uniref:Uncharacterized protein n=1 Tax=Rhodococcoides trifolii TaxID=908250 RepID=A0A917D1R2_9NOCA|nr:hypothetical protein [Rhodococcus trifolii]GGG07878.1 hypothetical protein GCM10007304_22410 [Rhodococcus trifolii]